MDTISGQDKEDKQHGSRQASRLTVAGLFALAGARLGAELSVVYNLLTGKGKGPPSNDNLLVKTTKILTTSIWQKNNLIAAGIGAGVLGIMGWVRGERIAHPIDLLKHPLGSLKLILFGKNITSNITPNVELPNPSLSLSNKETKENEKSWQQKTAAEHTAKQNIGIG